MLTCPFTLQSYVDAAGSGVRNAKDAVSSRIEAGKQKVGDVYETTTEVAYSTRVCIPSIRSQVANVQCKSDDYCKRRSVV